MACDYCKEDKLLLVKDTMTESMYNYGDKTDYIEQTLCVVVDRGYLRLVDIEDRNCIEGGRKIRINFCPMCGKKVEQM